jgi:hypothetical protein
MNKVLRKSDINSHALLQIFQRASLDCKRDGDDIDFRATACGLYCIRIAPKPEVVEIFKEMPVSAPPDLARELANRLNSISAVQWAYVEGTPTRSPFYLARICLSFQHGIIIPQLVAYARDFPGMICTLVGVIGAKIDLSGPRATGSIH